MAEFKLEILNPIPPRPKIAPGKHATNDYSIELMHRTGILKRRMAAYGPIAGQLDKLWHDIDDGRIIADTESSNTWYAHVKLVKDSFVVPPMPVASNTSTETITTSFNPFDES